VWNIISPDDWKKRLLLEVQPNLVESRNRISKKVQELFKAKDELIKEIQVLYNYAETALLSKIWPVDLAKLLIWVESVFHR
jgi:hypothetical protein